MPVSIKEIEVSTKDLALFFDVSRQTIRVWNQKGMPKVKKGVFSLWACSTWWRENISGEWQDSTLTEERRQKTVIERKIKEIELKEKEGSLVPADTAVIWLTQAVSNARLAFQGFPRRMAGVVALLTDEKDVEFAIHQEIRLILTELAKPLKGGKREKK